MKDKGKVTELFLQLLCGLKDTLCIYIFNAISAFSMVADKGWLITGHFFNISISLKLIIFH